MAALWGAAGVPVLSADDLARRAVSATSPGLEDVVQAFGREFLTSEGTLDRAALRRYVFEDEEARTRLEQILHPRIQVFRDRWMRRQVADGAEVVVSEIPLLFETGMEHEFDHVVVVYTPEEERFRRLVEDRGLPAAEAKAIMAAQMDAEEQRGRAAIVIDNDGTREQLADRARTALTEMKRLGGREGARPGWMRLDMHMHTCASWDCLSDPHALLERARSRGIHRIAITDHNVLGMARRMAEEFPDEVIAGEEVKTAEGIDVIGLYLTHEIPTGTPAAEVCSRVKEQGGIVYLPHPFARGKGGSGRFAEGLGPQLDIVEVFNARMHPERLNEPAEEFAARWGLPRGAGSDAHMVGEVAGGFVEVPVHDNRPEALLAAMGSSRVRGRTAPWAVHLASTWAKVRKRLP